MAPFASLSFIHYNSFAGIDRNAPNHNRCAIADVKRPSRLTMSARTENAFKLDRNTLEIEEQNYFATCARGLGHILADELRGSMINAHVDHVAFSGVKFRGSSQVGYSACLWLRSAMRVLQLIECVQITKDLSPSAIYDATRSIAGNSWSELLDCGNLTFNVIIRTDSSFSQDSRLIRALAIGVKDAICDTLRDSGFPKPDPPPSHAEADIPLFVSIHSSDTGRSALDITFYRDLVGSSLHKRGYRANTSLHRSALNEAVAAGMLYLSGFTPSGAFSFPFSNSAENNVENNVENNRFMLIDPMCGSGTLLIEAALLRLRVAVGLYRREPFPFEKWPDFQYDVYEMVRERAIRTQLTDDSSIGMKLLGNDINPSAVRTAQLLVDRMRLDSVIQLTQLDVDDLDVDDPWPMVVVSNPPWGRRIDGEEHAWGALGNFLKRHGQVDDSGTCTGAVLLSGDPGVTRGLRMKSSASHPVRIGNLDTRVLRYEVFPQRRSGSFESHTPIVIKK